LRAGPSPPAEQRPYAPPPLPTEQRVRAGFLPCCAMTASPTGTSDTEAADLEAAAAAAAAAPPSDLQQQELAVRLAKEKDSAAAKER
jgi:hypothetical protein